MSRNPGRNIVRLAMIGVPIVAMAFIAGCVNFSGGTWAFRSAPLPEGWPELTPVGEIHVKNYPAVRAAIVENTSASGEPMNPMFMTLFGHISSNGIPMTAPVEMGYQTQPGDSPRIASMAFLYRTPDEGRLGADGTVVVRDIGAQTFASVGVRGDYTTKRMQENLDNLQRWLEDHEDEWRVVGPPRSLGYNGPFTLWFLRYGEVQVPVEPVAAPD